MKYSIITRNIIWNTRMRLMLKGQSYRKEGKRKTGERSPD